MNPPTYGSTAVRTEMNPVPNAGINPVVESVNRANIWSIKTDILLITLIIIKYDYGYSIY